MELDQLHKFYIVAKELGFSKAAKKLKIQQPAVSKSVQILESDLEVKLFDRNKRSVRLTSDGAELYRICHEIFHHVEQIKNYIQSRDQTLRGDLKFGASDSLVSQIIPKILHTFLKTHPLVKPSVFSASSPAILEEITQGDLEFGLFFTQPNLRSFDVEEIVELPFVLVGLPFFKLKKDRYEHFIASRENEYRGEKSFPVNEMLLKVGIHPKIKISTNNLEAQKQMILKGLGVGLLPHFLVRSELSSGRLVRLEPTDHFQFSLKRVIKKEKTISKVSETFLELFKLNIKKLL